LQFSEYCADAKFHLLLADVQLAGPVQRLSVGVLVAAHWVWVLFWRLFAGGMLVWHVWK
jgi:hypothetical protein